MQPLFGQVSKVDFRVYSNLCLMDFIMSIIVLLTFQFMSIFLLVEFMINFYCESLYLTFIIRV